MITPWLIRLQVGRDDDGGLGDDVIAELSASLATGDAQPVLSRADASTVTVQLTVSATNDQSARSTAEGMLRERASAVWAAHDLPPFTISFVEAVRG
jgi:hypothetical protein